MPWMATVAGFTAHKSRLLLGLSVAAVVLVVDQLSKILVLRSFDLMPFTAPNSFVAREGAQVLPFFEINLVWNRGISFGLLAADTHWQKLILVAVALAVVTVVTVWLTRVRNRLTAVAIGLVIGGALGNVIDRLSYGAVVDFLDFSKLGFQWVFNVADASINVAVGLLILDLVVSSRDNAG